MAQRFPLKAIFAFLTLAIVFSACRKKVMSPYEFALLSADVYDNKYVEKLPRHFQTYLEFEESAYLPPKEKRDTSKLSKGEKLFKTLFNVVTHGGYFGRAYLNKSNQHIVIAHRGTDFDFEKGKGVSITSILKTVKDLDDDLNIAKGVIPQEHFDAALYFSKKVRDQYKKQYGKEPVIIHTGHSLGAVVAELCAIKENQKAVTFESPGTYPMVEQLLGKKNFDQSKFDITTYNGPRNQINSIHKQVGKVIQLDKDSSQVSGDGFSKNGKKIKVDLNSHYMNNILEHFNPKTGQPKISEVKAH